MINEFLRQLGVPPSIRIKLSFFLHNLFFVLKNGYRFMHRRDPLMDTFNKFKEYVDINQKRLPDIIANLKRDLSKAEQNLIDTLIERYLYIQSHNLIEVRFTPVEIKQQVILEKKQSVFKSKYAGLPEYEEQTFCFHHGLTLLPAKALKKIRQKDAIDAGAYNGDSSIIFSKEYQFRGIYAFEPDPTNFTALSQNIQKFKLQNVHPVNMGLSNKKGVSWITSRDRCSCITPDGKNDKVIITTIDDFVAQNKLNVGMIKMDIEGFEYNAVLGAINTIKRFLPVLLLAIYHTPKDFFEIKPLIESMVPNKYKYMIRKLDPFELVIETVLICYPK